MIALKGERLYIEFNEEKLYNGIELKPDWQTGFKMNSSTTRKIHYLENEYFYMQIKYRINYTFFLYIQAEFL